MRPDFTGDYALNRAASTLSTSAAGVQSAHVHIEHAEPQIHYQASFVASDRELKATFDRLTDGHPVTSAHGELSTLSSVLCGSQADQRAGT